MKTLNNIQILLERLARVVQNEAHAGGLKPTQWEVLRYLARANHFSRSPSAVTAYLGMTKGTVSQTLNALENKELVRKQTQPTDRRNIRLELTRKALALLASDPLENILASASGLTRVEQRNLEQGLSAILQDVLRRREGRPFGVCKTCRFHRANAKDGVPHRCELLDVALTDDDSERICIEYESAA